MVSFQTDKFPSGYFLFYLTVTQNAFIKTLPMLVSRVRLKYLSIIAPRYPQCAPKGDSLYEVSSEKIE